MKTTPMNPASLIGKTFTLASLIPTKGGHIYNTIEQITFDVDGRVSGGYYQWCPYGNGGIALTDQNHKPLIVFSSKHDGCPLGLRLSTRESIVLLGEQGWRFWEEQKVNIQITNPADQAIVNDSLEIEQRDNRASVNQPYPGERFIYPNAYLDKREESRYKVTLAIPHLNTIEALKVAIELWRVQTERPYIMVIDTGSCPEACKKLEEMRADDVEIHYIASQRFSNGSAPVTAALDLAQTLCMTKHLLHTHSDVFPMRDDLVEDLYRSVNNYTPIIGYQMSPRDGSDGKLPKTNNQWRGMVGHALLMVYMPIIHTIGATWSMQRVKYQFGFEYEITHGWPDTETGFNLCLQNHKIKPIFWGEDVNFERQTDRNIDHPRSYTGSMITKSPMFAECKEWMFDAIVKAKERLSLTKAKRQENLRPNRQNHNQHTPGPQTQSVGAALRDTCPAESPHGPHHQVSETQDHGGEPSRPYKQTHQHGQG